MCVFLQREPVRARGLILNLRRARNDIKLILYVCVSAYMCLHACSISLCVRFTFSAVQRWSVHAVILNLLENRGESPGTEMMAGWCLLCWALTPLWSLAKYWSTTDLIRGQLLWSDDHMVVNVTQVPKMLKILDIFKILLFQSHMSEGWNVQNSVFRKACF